MWQLGREMIINWSMHLIDTGCVSCFDFLPFCCFFLMLFWRDDPCNSHSQKIWKVQESVRKWKKRCDPKAPPPRNSSDGEFSFSAFRGYLYFFVNVWDIALPHTFEIRQTYFHFVLFLSLSLQTGGVSAM